MDNVSAAPPTEIKIYINYNFFQKQIIVTASNADECYQAKDFILCIFENACILYLPVWKNMESKHFIKVLNVCLVSLITQIHCTKSLCLTISTVI